MFWRELSGSLFSFGLLGASFLAGACSQSDGRRSQAAALGFPVVISAQRDAQRPLAGVKIFQDKKVLGATDDSGKVRLTLKGSEGETLSLTVRCPEAFASPEQPIVVGLRHMASGSPAPRFETLCVPLVHTLVVGLRADNGPNLPIIRLNEVIGETDAQGVAHVVVQAAPNEQVTLTLDTSGNHTLKPQSPTLTFVAQDRDEMVLLEQKFTVLKKVIKAKPKTIPKPL